MFDSVTKWLDNHGIPASAIEAAVATAGNEAVATALAEVKALEKKVLELLLGGLAAKQ